MASGRSADEEDPRFGGALSGTPPVPTTAIFSRTDGICAWQGCMEKSSATSESIEVESSHCGMGHHPAAVYAVADRLAQPEGKWMPFDRRAGVLGLSEPASVGALLTSPPRGNALHHCAVGIGPLGFLAKRVSIMLAFELLG